LLTTVCIFVHDNTTRRRPLLLLHGAAAWCCCMVLLHGACACGWQVKKKISYAQKALAAK
jgi:hypothetical protein